MDKTRSLKRALPFIFAVTGSLVYISLSFDHNVWLDEAFSASIIRCDFSEMISRTFSDTLPPFYNVAAWCFTRIFGFSTLSLKLFSVLPMTALMIITAFLLPGTGASCCGSVTTDAADGAPAGAENEAGSTSSFSGGIAAACIYIAFITFMPHFLEHGVEIRMYSWALFFASASAVFAYCMMRGMKKLWIPLVICTVLGAYTHQFALIAEAFIWLMLLIFHIRNKSVRHWIAGAISCFVLYIPCAILTLKQMKKASSYFAAAGGGLSGLMSAMRYPYVTNVTLISALLLFTVAALAVAAAIKKEFAALFMICIYVIVSLLSYALMALTGSTFFSARYLMPAIGILWLGVALAASSFMKPLPSKIVCVILIVLVAIPVYRGQVAEASVDTSEFEAFIGGMGPYDGYVMFENAPEIEWCIGYYAPEFKRYELSDIEGIAGKKYLFFSSTYEKDPEDVIKEKDLDAEYVGTYTFDRYKYIAFILR